MSALEVLDGITLNFSPGALTVMNIIIAFVMFGVALQINLSEFKEVIKNPKSFFVGVFVQIFMLPFMTFLLCLVLRPILSLSVAMGMLLVASCPGGNISNFMTALAKGNIPLGVSMTAFSTLNCVIVTPFNFWFWGNLYCKFLSKASTIAEEPIYISFMEMAQTVVVLLVIPIVLGMLFAHYFPRLSQTLTKPMSIISMVVFAFFIVAALSNNFNHFMTYIHLFGMIVILHNALALSMGNIAGRLARLSIKDLRAVTIESGIQNSGLGLILIFNNEEFLKLGGMAFVAAWWGIWHIISGMGIAFYWSRKKEER